MFLSASALGFTVTLNERTDTAFKGQASSLAVTANWYGKSEAWLSKGVQQNLPVWCKALGSTTLKVAPGIPLFQLMETVSGSGLGSGAGGV